IDHVATVREARKGKSPDPVAAAVLAELGGADGIVVHLREDRRHIQDRDLRILRETLRTPLDLEMAATEEMVKIALEIKPEMVTLVPERRRELTTEGGLNVAAYSHELKKMISLLREGEIRVSLFIDPDPAQIKAAHKISADVVEIHTGRYANSRGKNRQNELHQIAEAAKLASKLGMGVNAGHGLDYHNVVPVAEIPEIRELNIGHSIVSRAVLVGMERAVREMKGLISKR
ncbi:MAG TPA: pyridoxine 5'-phosphate synthase, partial [Candidatus Manganitrophaceae bacterium]|nr:pyridoxine 5'-phosphate synthase [Candidatus Manganitrophaceae bacterium]